MKSLIKFSVIAVIGLSTIFTFSCKREEVSNSKNGILKEKSIPILCFYKTVKDTDGNVYKTVVIGTQTWMASNLKTTHFNDGTDIPTSGRFTPCYHWYNDNILNKTTYGALYNWAAASSGKLAPKGWHVASNNEWSILINFLGGKDIAGGKLKEKGTIHWLSPNTGATNSYCFTGLPAGCIMYQGAPYQGLGTNAYFWTSSPWDSSDPSAPYFAWYRFLNYNNTSTTPSNLYITKDACFSIRCIKD